MYKLNCIVVDDEQIGIDILNDYIKETPFLNCVFTTQHPVSALEFINNMEVDIIFLDINMPKLNGIEFAKAIQNNKAKIIFTTAYDEFAIQGYELSVIDYLLKPIPFTRFLKAAQKALNFFENKKMSDKAKKFLTVQGDMKGSYKKIDFDEIIFIESKGNYVIFECKDRKVICRATLSSISAQLPANQFLRIHKSHIVKLESISSMEGNKINLKTNPQKHLIVSSFFKSDLLKYLK